MTRVQFLAEVRQLSLLESVGIDPRVKPALYPMNTRRFPQDKSEEG
jgi:hypothetical protein